MRVLDACAAPGGKTAFCAELMGNEGEIAACDVHPRRLQQVERECGRLGIRIVRTAVADASLETGRPPGEFGKVLVDAPCSGLGVLRRIPEGKWWKSPGDVAALSGVQRAILRNAARSVAPGGVLVYATCSTAVEENESVVDDFLSSHDDFMLEDCGRVCPSAAPLCTPAGTLRTWPHLHGMDGFAAARLKRRV